MTIHFSELKTGDRFRYDFRVFTKTATCAATNQRGACVLFRNRTRVEAISEDLAAGAGEQSSFQELAEVATPREMNVLPVNFES